MKKMIVLLLLAILILGSVSFAVETKEISPCPIHGIHEMIFQQGLVQVLYDGEIVPGDHYLYECDCGEQMITTGLPHLFGWGIYNYWYDTEFTIKQSALGGTSYIVDFEDGHYEPGSTLPGYRFYDNPAK